MNSNNKLPIQVCTWALIDGGWLPFGTFDCAHGCCKLWGADADVQQQSRNTKMYLRATRTYVQCAGLCHTGIPALTANWAEFFKNCVKGVSPNAYVAMKICQLLWFINVLKTYEFSLSTIVIACNFRKSTSKININLNSNWGKTLTFLRIGFKPAIITTARSQRSNIPYGAFTFLKRSHHMKWLVNHLVTHKKFCYMLHRSYISQEEHT